MSILKKNRVSKLTPVKKGSNKYARCYVTRDGVRKEIFLGRWGTEEVETEYRRLCAEIYDDMPPVVPVYQVTLAELFSKYLEYAKPRLKKPEMSVVKTIIDVVFQFYPEVAVGDFTAMPYRAVQSHLVRIAPNPPAKEPGKEARVWSRQHVNRLMKSLRAIFKWGISYDLVPPEILEKHKSVPAIKKGEYPWLKETVKRLDVPDDVVLLTLPFLPPTVADMVRIQRGASMRPGEVCTLKVGDFDTSGELWHVGKREHKTDWTGVERFFSFNRAETEILRRRCAGKLPEDYVFSPREAMAERWEAKATARKSVPTPSQRLRAERAAAVKFDRIRDFYDSVSYENAIGYALEKARKAGVEIPHWTPYQLRHAAITDNALRYGEEVAGKIAGHKSQKTTEIYNHTASKLSRKAAAEREAWW